MPSGADTEVQDRQSLLHMFSFKGISYLGISVAKIPGRNNFMEERFPVADGFRGVTAVAEAKCNSGGGLIDRGRNFHTRLFPRLRTGSRET